MLIVGALSGIQDYVFDVAREGGRQARRLRARSFFVQLASECALLRICHAARWTMDTVAMRAAGRFVLAGAGMDEDGPRRVRDSAAEIGRWLLNSVGWQLRFSLVVDDGGGDPDTAYRRATASLRSEEARPGSNVAISQGRWRPEVLVLPPISPPCAVCLHRRAEHSEPVEDSEKTRQVCLRCRDDLRLGKDVTDQSVLVIYSSARLGTYDVLGLGVSFTDAPPVDEEQIWGWKLLRPRDSSKDTTLPSSKQISGGLLAELPRDRRGRPIEFVDLARRAMGDVLLGVLKMDVDSLGDTVSRALRDAADFKALSRFSTDLDQFFTRTLAEQQHQPAWSTIYTVFAGGDDLLVIGPWNVVLDYSLHVQRLFRQRFPELTISAGIAFIKPKLSIPYAVAQAEDLLEDAKTRPGTRAMVGKAQCATLGQIFQWPDLVEIVAAGKRWTEWVQGGIAPRGWLHQLLEVAEAGRGPAAMLGPARLAYQVERNYPSERAGDPRRRALRQWVDARVSDLDAPRTLETIGLAAIIRYALIATRTRQEDD